MNVLIKIAIYGIVDYFLFKFGLYYGLFGLVIIIYQILRILGFFRHPQISKASFCEGISFLKDYQGSYKNCGAGIEEALKIIKTFKLDEIKVKYVVIGIFYDNPETVEESKLRYSIGIYQRNLGFAENPPRELESYCKDNNYYFAELPNANSIYGSWEYSNSFALMKGIDKFYSGLKTKLNDDSFLKTYRVKKGTKCETIVEVYEFDSKIAFYAPLLNVDKFNLYKKDNKTN